MGYRRNDQFDPDPRLRSGWGRRSLSEEVDDIKTEAFDHLIEFEYYLFIGVNGTWVTSGRARNFRAYIENGRLIYDFVVPLKATIRWDDMTDLILFLFDSSYFIDFRSEDVVNLTVSHRNRDVVFSTNSETIQDSRLRDCGINRLGSGFGESEMSTSAPTNPFTGQTVTKTEIPVPDFLKDLGFTFQESLMNASRSVIDEGDIGAGLLAFGVAVVFGMIHIVGFGHGKIFTMGYFGSRRAKLTEGLWLSALVNILDSLSALLLVSIAYGILSVSLRAAGASVDRITRLVAYAAVALLGAGHLAAHLRSSHRHHEIPGRKMKPWMLALSVGLIPCPVSSAILAWGIVNDALGFSLLLVVGVSFGGMIAMTGFSFALIGGKAGLTRLLNKRGFSRVLNGIEIGSMVFFGCNRCFAFR